MHSTRFDLKPVNDFWESLINYITPWLTAVLFGLLHISKRDHHTVTTVLFVHYSSYDVVSVKNVLSVTVVDEWWVMLLPLETR